MKKQEKTPKKINSIILTKRRNQYIQNQLKRMRQYGDSQAINFEPVNNHNVSDDDSNQKPKILKIFSYSKYSRGSVDEMYNLVVQKQIQLNYEQKEKLIQWSARVLDKYYELLYREIKKVLKMVYMVIQSKEISNFPFQENVYVDILQKIINFAYIEVEGVDQQVLNCLPYLLGNLSKQKRSKLQDETQLLAILFYKLGSNHRSNVYYITTALSIGFFMSNIYPRGITFGDQIILERMFQSDCQQLRQLARYLHKAIYQKKAYA